MKSARIAACSCGELQAQVAAVEPLRVSVCHCLACQRRTGSVFGMQARFPREAVTVSGERSEYTRVGDAGSTARLSFCPRCGATVFYTFDEQPEAIAIPVGAFADPGFPPPDFSVYEERKHAWVQMPEGIARMD